MVDEATKTFLQETLSPDGGNGEKKVEEKTTEEKFIDVKAAFDRLIELNEQYDGRLLVDSEAELAEKIA